MATSKTPVNFDIASESAEPKNVPPILLQSKLNPLLKACCTTKQSYYFYHPKFY